MLTSVVESKSRCRAEACSHLLGALELNINKNNKQVIFLKNEMIIILTNSEIVKKSSVTLI